MELAASTVGAYAFVGAVYVCAIYFHLQHPTLIQEMACVSVVHQWKSVCIFNHKNNFYHPVVSPILLLFPLEDL